MPRARPAAGSAFLFPSSPPACQHPFHNHPKEGMKRLVSLWKTALEKNPGGALKIFSNCFFSFLARIIRPLWQKWETRGKQKENNESPKSRQPRSPPFTSASHTRAPLPLPWAATASQGGTILCAIVAPALAREGGVAPPARVTRTCLRLRAADTRGPTNVCLILRASPSLLH